LNILFLSTEIPYPPDHGHHIRTYNILKLLAETHRVFFVGFAKEKSELQYVNQLVKFCETVDIFLIRGENNGWHFLLSLFTNLFSPLPLVAQKYYRKEAGLRIKQILRENKIDLVHFDMLHLSRYLKHIDSLPKILVNHNVESLRLLRWMKIEKNIPTKLYLFFQFLKLKHFEKRTCPKFDKCIVVSQVDKQVLIRMTHSDNFVTIPNGVDTDYFKPTNGKIVANSLVWVGAMDDPHNRYAVDYFLDKILPLIQAKVSNVQATFVGGSPTVKLIKKAKKNPNIKITGYVKDIRPYVQHAAVFIAPLRSGSGTKIKILNALALGKAVVTTSIGAEGIDIEADKHVMIADSAHDFANKTIFLLKNPVAARKMGIEARRIIEKNYDWRVVNEKMNLVYSNILKAKRGTTSQAIDSFLLV